MVSPAIDVACIPAGAHTSPFDRLSEGAARHEHACSKVQQSTNDGSRMHGLPHLFNFGGVDDQTAKPKCSRDSSFICSRHKVNGNKVYCKVYWASGEEVNNASLALYNRQNPLLVDLNKTHKCSPP